MQRSIPIALAIALAALMPQSNPVQAQSSRSRTTPPALHLMMDLDRQVGLEQVFKSTIEKPIAQTCPDRRWAEKIKTQVVVKFELVEGQHGARSLLFEHEIGTNLATYWVYDLREVRNLNQDEFVDLVFYTGDDTSDETVLLLRKADHYKAIYAGNTGHWRNKSGAMIGEIRFSDQKFTRWDAKQEVFVGEGVAWVKGDCIPFRKTPNSRGEMIFPLFENALVEVLETRGAWQKVRIDGAEEGWVEGRSLSKTSLTKVFSLK